MADDAPRALCGFLNLNKPAGRTSRDALDLVARPLKRAKVKVGHAGTLDPLATGVLVAAVGPATRLIAYVQDQPKTYRAAIRLGATSDTLDADGQVTEIPDPPIPDEGQIRAALATQVGTILQRPPEVSALKVGGARAYDLARAGKAVDLAPRDVRVDRIDLLSYTWPRLEIEVACGGGTYIRSIARDVGELLGCGGLIEVLTRTRIGPFRLEDAIDPAAVAWSPEAVAERLIPAVAALDGLPRVALDEEQVTLVRQGRALDAGRLGVGPIAGGEVALIDARGDLIAVAEHCAEVGAIRPRRVLARD